MNTIHVIGLGAGDLEQMSIGVYRMLQKAGVCYVRTKEHPVVEQLNEEVVFHSFDHCYMETDAFDKVYERIVGELLNIVEREGTILYAVPGHPLVAEETVVRLIQEREKGTLQVKIHGGTSFIDEMLRTLEIDPIEGFTVLDATAIEQMDINPNQHLFICQLYDQFVASNVKISLMQFLPDDYTVYYVSGAGTQNEEIKAVQLYEMDHAVALNNLATLYVPRATKREDNMASFTALKQTIAALRAPGGCPWDQQQTHQSLRRYAVEEVYEMIEAVDNDDEFALEEELGDVLLQVLLHAQIAEEDGGFSIYDVVRTLHEKMIRRHPHVFGEEAYDTADEVRTRWEQLKQAEKMTEPNDFFAKVNRSEPQLMQAYTIQKLAGKVGFDWNDAAPMWDKVREEMEEFQQAVRDNDCVEMEKEWGDLAFALVNIARFYGISPEIALSGTNRKFMRRFSYIERAVKQSGKPYESYTLQQLDQLWEDAKGEE
ncbi:MAG: nucleoside triphosphate pyrophosphohydrolase [Bacilli bacterium]